MNFTTSCSVCGHIHDHTCDDCGVDLIARTCDDCGYCLRKALGPLPDGNFDHPYRDAGLDSDGDPILRCLDCDARPWTHQRSDDITDDVRNADAYMASVASCNDNTCEYRCENGTRSVSGRFGDGEGPCECPVHSYRPDYHVVATPRTVRLWINLELDAGATDDEIVGRLRMPDPLDRPVYWGGFTEGVIRKWIVEARLSRPAVLA